MANYYGVGRSNCFRVKDREAFQAFCNRWSLELIDKTPDLVGFMDNGDGFMNDGYQDEAGEIVEADLFDDLVPHLQDGEVAVIMETGHEKHNYLVGWATALHSDGRTITVDLGDIYQKTLDQWGVKPTLADY